MSTVTKVVLETIGVSAAAATVLTLVALLG